MKDKQFTIFYQEGEGGSGAYYTGDTIEELVNNFAELLKSSLSYYADKVGCKSFEIKLTDIDDAEDSCSACGEDVAETQYKVGDIVLVADVGGHTSAEGKITDIDKGTDNGVLYYRYYINFNENESEKTDDDDDSEDDDEANGYYDDAQILCKVR